MISQTNELVDIIDRNNNTLSTIRRSDIQRGKHPVRFVYVFVMDASGNFILQQRHHSKSDGPNLIEAVAGWVSSGETFEQTAVKELYEEYGLNTPVEHLFELWNEERGLCSVFKTVYDGNLEDLILEEGSVARVFKMSKHEIYTKMRKVPFVFRDAFQSVFMHFWQSQFGFEGLNIYNENAEVIGTCSWEEMLDNDVIAGAASLFVENNKGEILLQKRGSKVMMPNRLCFSAAGTIDAGENAEQTVIREAEEEIAVSDLHIKYVDHFFQEYHEDEYSKKEWLYVYHAYYDGEIRTNEYETESAAWFTECELKMMMHKMPSLFTSGVLTGLTRLFEWKQEKNKELSNDKAI